ncbi:MAG TPA: AlkA N-terminal domain-containing protein [Streptosporangiaceae bacterium]|nr:AlkA N-terminal domain-containing protein [Streptosporangiaceae bacterium]
MGETGQAARLVIEPSAPFRLDYVVWALRRRAHNEVDRFDGGCYRRVLCLAGEPAEVTVRQDPAAGTLTAELRGPAGPAGRAAAAGARPVLERMLGLGADLRGFYRVAAGDARLDALAARFRGMRPPCFPTVFEAVVNAVACQQLSLDVGIHLLNRLARRFGPAVPGPVTRYGFPAPDRLAGAEPAELRALGFSTAKARTIIAVAGQVTAGTLDLEALRDTGDDKAMGILLGLPGIGRWSAEYVLLRGLARYHVLPGDDVGARNNLRRRFGLAQDAGYDAVASLSRRWQPYAGLVYFHLLLDALADRGYLEEAR